MVCGTHRAMVQSRRSFSSAAVSAASLLAIVIVTACGSSNRSKLDSNGNAGGAVSNANMCGSCSPDNAYTTCDAAGNNPKTDVCPPTQVCVPNRGCLACAPGGTVCVGNEVHECAADATPGAVKTTCDAKNGQICQNGACLDACAAAAKSQSNLGCEFWAVDLDQSDLFPVANSAWGVVLSSASDIPADVTIERNDAPVGQPPQPAMVFKATLQPGNLISFKLPQRELDCGKAPDDHDAPGTCLSSNAYRITSSAPIVAYQFNNFVHNYSTDASLLLPTSVLGKVYRNVGWPPANPYATPGAWTMRSYVTIVGTQPGTTVNVSPSFRIHGNGPIPKTEKNGTISVTIGTFDVLNLESDDSSLGECFNKDMKPPYCADLTGTVINANAPVAVFSGVESTGVGPQPDAPKPPSWGENSGCCHQHLEEQVPPLEAAGKKFVITRSPIRSDQSLSDYVEPDVLRFVGAAAPSQVKTNLPPPLDNFQILPGQIVETWTTKDIVVDASEPILVAQYLVIQDYVNGNPKGDPSFTIFPPLEQQRTEYVFLSPDGWKENYVVFATDKNNDITVDGALPKDCVTANAGTIDGKTYEARRCQVPPGVHRISGKTGFGLMAYGYADADVYAFPGGAFVKKIYEPPPLK